MWRTQKTKYYLPTQWCSTNKDISTRGRKVGGCYIYVLSKCQRWVVRNQMWPLESRKNTDAFQRLATIISHVLLMLSYFPVKTCCTPPHEASSPYTLKSPYDCGGKSGLCKAPRHSVKALWIQNLVLKRPFDVGYYLDCILTRSWSEPCFAIGSSTFMCDLPRGMRWLALS